MRRYAMLLAVTVLGTMSMGACTGRQVEVSTGAAPAAEASVSLRVANDLDQPVNVYVVTGGSEMFVRQVPAKSTDAAVVRGVAPGSVVMLRARPVDGRQVYEKADVTLAAGVFEWRVP